MRDEMFDPKEMAERHAKEGLDDFDHYFMACGEMIQEIMRLEAKVASLEKQLEEKE
jgi:hypothetical protein